MAIRVHLAIAHAALPALLPTPPVWKMLPPLLPTPPCPCVAASAILPKPGRADADERWDARKTTKPASAQPSASSSSSSSGPRRSAHSSVRSSGSSARKNANGATSPPYKLGRADSVERWWGAHKKAAASPAASSSSSGTSSLVSSSKWPINRASSSSAERWDAHKKRCLTSQADQRLDDGESSSSASNDDVDTDEEEEEIVWKPRALYTGPGFAVAATERPSLLPMPTSFLVPVA